MYQQEKKSRDSKPKGQEVKVVQVGFKTGQHDLIIRAEQTDKFLEKGHRVKIDLRLRGREKAMKDLARQKLEAFLTFITYPHTAEETIKATPNGFSIIIKPDKKTRHESQT